MVAASRLRSLLCKNGGGVIEHPEASKAWQLFGLMPPLRNGGWSVADDCGGWTCCVEQGHYGHRARKATWLYAVGTDLLSLRWGRSKVKGRLIDNGFHSAEERRMFTRPPKDMSKEWREKRKRWLQRRAEAGAEWCSPERMCKREREATPTEFRDLLISLARSVKP